MADLRECFPSLADETTGAGECLISRIEGEAAASQEGSIGFSFKDSSGNVVLPQLTAAGAIVVDNGGAAGTCKFASAKVAGSLTETTVVALTLTATKTYHKIEVIAAAYRETSYLLVQHDNGVDTTIGEFITGPGQYTVDFNIDCLDVTAGATGTQELRLRALNLEKVTDIRGTVAALELN